MRYVLVSFIISACLSIGLAQPKPMDSLRVLNYKEWKLEKLQVVLTRISSLRAQLAVAFARQQPVPAALRKALLQEEWNLETTKDLGVNEYFVLYLAPQKPSSAKMLEAVEKLTPGEVTVLLEAYARALYSNGSDRENEAARLSVQATEQSGLAK